MRHVVQPGGTPTTIGSGLLSGLHTVGAELCAGTTTVWVHANVGFGNKVTIRGGTSPLSWTAGKDCVNRAADLWECLVVGLPDHQPFGYKVLVNDSTWSTGTDYQGVGAQPHDIYPAF